LVSDIPAGDRKTANLFYSVIEFARIACKKRTEAAGWGGEYMASIHG
jgi:hypothetical protein